MCPECNRNEKVKGYKYCGYCLDKFRGIIRKEQRKHDKFVHVEGGGVVRVLGG